MSSKRKAIPSKRGPVKKSKHHEDSDLDSDISGHSDLENNSIGGPQPDEVLIAGHGDLLDEEIKLPEELLKTMIKPAGQLVICGNMHWDWTGRRENKTSKNVHPNLWSPHRFLDYNVRLAVSGCVSAHSVLITEEGKAYTFGRNESGQLGVNHTTTLHAPTPVVGLEGLNIISAACGKSHTLFLTDTGTVYACGDNRAGQCGIGSLQPQVLTPKRINYRGLPIIKIGCGGKFSVILDVKGGLHSFGLPEYGQLGHNTDGKYFKTSTKLDFNYQTSPKRIVIYIEKSKDGHVTPVDVTEIVDFSCGDNHTVAIDGRKRAFSWGFGGFGRLGHAEPKDEMVPRLIKFFDSQSRGVTAVKCGSSFCLALTDVGGMYMFGKTRRNGEANMYPKPIQDLAGWDVHHLAAGFTSIAVAADDSVITWGCSPCFGELGHGEMHKSSNQPKEMSALEGLKITGLSMGYSHTLMIAKNDTAEEKAKLEELDLYTP